MSPVGTHAEAQEIDGEFVDFQGSAARKQGIASWSSDIAAAPSDAP
jgi:hypothetical protein